MERTDAERETTSNRRLPIDVLGYWRNASPMAVVAQASVLAVAGMICSSALLSAGSPYSGGAMLAMLDKSTAVAITRALVIPPLETLAWQAFPTAVCAWFGLNRWLSVVVPAALFAVTLHWTRGAGAIVSAFWFWAVLGAVFVSQGTRVRAFALTTLVHYAPILLLMVLSLLIRSGVLSDPSAVPAPNGLAASSK